MQLGSCSSSSIRPALQRSSAVIEASEDPVLWGQGQDQITTSSMSTMPVYTAECDSETSEGFVIQSSVAGRLSSSSKWEP
jgi:hypothetical protein